MVYLDWAATAPPDRNILQSALDTAVRHFGNPSSLHPAGEQAESVLEDCRRSLAGDLGCQPEELIFTSGGSESNNLVVSSILSFLHRGRPGTHGSQGRNTIKVIVSGIEHASVFTSAGSLARWGVEVRFVRTGRSGILDPEAIRRELSGEVRLVSTMLVNNETGALQPVADIARTVGDYAKTAGRRILLHSDAVQAFGKIPLDLHTLGVQALSISSHKLGGPRGVGALCLARGAHLDPIYRGGQQERGLRPGTENLQGIYGFAQASSTCVSRIQDNHAAAAGLMGHLLCELAAIDEVRIIPENRTHSTADCYSPYILKLALPPVPGQVLVRALGQREICVSTGSACSTRSKERNRVLANMGIPDELAESSIRVSIGPSTTRNDVDRFLETLRTEAPGLVRIAR